MKRQGPNHNSLAVVFFFSAQLISTIPMLKQAYKAILGIDFPGFR